MRILQITPGAGGMYCGNCFRDNALVSELRGLGHDTLMVPLYLPMTLDEADQSAGTPVFFGGVNVYLDQQLGWYRHLPAWVRRWLDSPAVLRWAAGRAASTRAGEVGDITLSMLRGEDGNQRRELAELLDWLKTQPAPDVTCLSNALLLGLARSLRQTLGTRVVCMLQGEDAFVDSMPEPHRGAVWRALRERAADVDLFVSPSRYFADRMMERLAVNPDRVRVVPNGISLEGYALGGRQGRLSSDASSEAAEAKEEARRAEEEGPKVEGRRPTPPHSALRTPHFTIGYFARLCRDKGLDTLVDAFIRLRKGGRAGAVRLRIGGGLGPADQPFVSELKRQLDDAGLSEEVDWMPNPDRAAKIRFLESLDVFSVPARSGEAYGLYLLEALAAGAAVVQPDTAAFPEILQATDGGVLFEPENAQALAEALEKLLLDRDRLHALGRAGQTAVRQQHTARHMAERMLAVFRELDPASVGSATHPPLSPATVAR